MQRHGVVLCIHGEVTDPDTDVFDREAIFVEHSLTQVVRDFPALKVVVEHITTREAADFVASAPGNVAATITPQHLLYNRTSIFTPVASGPISIASRSSSVKRTVRR